MSSKVVVMILHSSVEFKRLYQFLFFNGNSLQEHQCKMRSCPRVLLSLLGYAEFFQCPQTILETSGKTRPVNRMDSSTTTNVCCPSRNFHKHTKLAIMPTLYFYFKFLSLFVPYDVGKCEIRCQLI